MNSPTRVLQPDDEGQFELGPVVEALSTSFTVVSGAKRLIRRMRLDTFDRRLQAAELLLEHQIVSSGEQVVLRRPDGSSTVAVPVKGLRWPGFPAALPQSPVRELVAPVTGIRALMVVADEKRRVQRLDLHNQDGKTVARVELDEPAVAAASSAEVHVHHLRGYEDQARRATLLLKGIGLRDIRVGASPLADSALSAPSAPRVFSVISGTSGPSASTEPEMVGGGRAAPATDLLTTVLRGFLTTMVENLPGLLDDVDTEFLHDFRVAVRRTRATLKLGRPALPEVIRSRWEPAFKWLGDLTTPVRDLDVYELGLPVMRSWLVSADAADLDPFATHLRSRRTAERRALVRGLRSVTFRRLVTEWGDDLARLRDTAERAQSLNARDESAGELLSAGQLADRGILKAYRRVTHDGATIGADSPAEDLHSLRKRCKELRYALEVFAPVIDDGARKRVVSDLKGLQDVLGAFQDTEVQRLALRGFAEEMMVDGTPAGAVLAMGELIGHLDADQDRARREFDVVFARFTRPSSLLRLNRLGGGA